ncbi:hypothetical protein CDL12_00718 [Handroanthus impetiginosus]|uniref:F-box domain-containing protein n=1 Tax=Handroanthus impetiginosus TaxID=429701 RepID=A0A2G9I9T1_9LAMI|nr:hypothetical protein CDL12_00718 [Handroanthus impetiginosus]
MANNEVYCKLPQDAILEILTKLPTKTLLQLRCVSKSFTPLISHPDFIKLHLSCTTGAGAGAPYPYHLIYYESTDYQKAYFSFHVDKSFSPCKILETPFKSINGYLRLVGSSRGIVCLFDTSYFSYVGTVILWNPFIGKFKILPSLQGLNCLRDDISHIAVGFGFDHRNFDFKVVKILYGCTNEREVPPEAFIYEVKIGTWRRLGSVVPCFMPRWPWSGSVFVNGIMHWLAYKRQLFSGPPTCIMALDLVNEVSKLMELPQNLGPNPKELRLSPLVDEKSVALFVSYHENVGKTWDMWLMNDYGEVESWTRKYIVVLEHVFFPLKIVNDGQTLAAISDEKLVLIDVEKEEVQDLEVCGLPLSFDMAGYTPSLALLDIGDRLVWQDSLRKQA